MKRFVVTLLLLQGMFRAAEAQEVPADRPAGEGRKPDVWGIGWHPVIGYDDKVKLTLGAACVLYFEPETRGRELDEVELHATYNWGRQYDFMANYSVYLADDAIRLEGEVGYQNYPDEFRGREYEAEYVPLSLGAAFRITDRVFAGPILECRFSRTGFEDEGQGAVPADVEGAGSMLSCGIGAEISYKDTPKGRLYHRSGSIAKLSGTYHPAIFRGSPEFFGLGADYRHYIPVFDSCVLAFQAAGKASLGDVPFFDLPALENKGILRGGGDGSGRYFLAAQAEFRFPVSWRIGAVVFLGVGEVQDRIRDFGTDGRIAGGAGLRIALNRDKNINLRLDLAFNDAGDSSRYVKIKEAF